MTTTKELPCCADFIGVLNENRERFYFVGEIPALIRKIHKIRYSTKLFMTCCSRNVSIVWYELNKKSLFSKEKTK